MDKNDEVIEFINGATAHIGHISVEIGCNDSKWIRLYNIDVDTIIRHGIFVDHWEE